MTAEGLWSGTTSTSRYMSGIILDTGTYWVLYSVANNPNIIAGVVQGTGSSLNGIFSSSDAKDFNLEGLGIHDGTISASYVSKQSFNGSITYPSAYQTSTFTSTYNSAYDQTPSLASLAGTYTGSVVVASVTETVWVVISSSGGVSGSGTSGCTFSGSAAPHAKGNVYDLSITFNGGACSNGTSTVTGIGYLNTTTNRLYAVALNSIRSNGFVFVGAKS